MNIRRNLETFFALIISIAASILWSVITTRVIGASGVGILSVVTVYPTFFFTIGHLTFGIGTIHYIGKQKYKLTEFAANSILVASSIGIVLYIISILTITLFKETFYKNINPIYLIITFLTIPMYLIFYFMTSILQGTNSIKQYNIANISRPCFAIILLSIIIAISSQRIQGAIIAFTASFMFASIISIYYVSKQTMGKWKVNLTLLKITLKSSIKMHIGSISTFIYGQVGIIITNYYMNQSDVGFFSIALIISQFLFLIPQAIQVTLYPDTSVSTEEEATLLSIKMCRNTIFIMIIIIILFSFISKYVILLLAGEEFLQSITPLIILLPGIIFSTVAQILSPLWVRKDWFWYLGYSGVILATISIILNLYLIPKYGIVGASLSSSLTYFVGFLITIGMFFFFIDKKFWKLLIVQKEDINSLIYLIHSNFSKGMKNFFYFFIFSSSLFFKFFSPSLSNFSSFS